MQRNHPLLVHDFLIPALEDGRYGERLAWVDRENRIFRVSWIHQSTKYYSEEDGALFKVVRLGTYVLLFCCVRDSQFLILEIEDNQALNSVW